MQPEDMVIALRSAGYRVLTPFVDRAMVYRDDPHTSVIALVDCETTSDADDAEVIQLAVQRVYCDFASVIRTDAPRVWLREPSVPITAEATAVHGLTIDDVRGFSIDAQALELELVDVTWLIAHNAAFDAPKVARLYPAMMEGRAWACSYRDIDWTARGYASAKLQYLLQDHTQCRYDAHDAGADVAALAHVLATPFADGTSPLTELRANCTADRFRVYATGAPFGAKDALKARRYQWDGVAKVWSIEVPEPKLNDEMEFVRPLAPYATAQRIPKRLRFLEAA